MEFLKKWIWNFLKKKELKLSDLKSSIQQKMSSINLLLQQNKFIQYKIKILMLIYWILKEINNTVNESIEDIFKIYIRYSNNSDLNILNLLSIFYNLF